MTQHLWAPKIGGFGCERMRNMTKWAHNSIPFLSDSNLQEYHWLFSFVWLCVIILVDLDMNDFIISNVEQVDKSSVKSGSKAGQAGLQKDEDYAKTCKNMMVMQPYATHLWILWWFWGWFIIGFATVTHSNKLESCGLCRQEHQDHTHLESGALVWRGSASELVGYFIIFQRCGTKGLEIDFRKHIDGERVTYKSLIYIYIYIYEYAIICINDLLDFHCFRSGSRGFHGRPSDLQWPAIGDVTEAPGTGFRRTKRVPQWLDGFGLDNPAQKCMIYGVDLWEASLILGASVFFFGVCAQPFCRKPWKLDCNILQQRVSHSDCNDRSFIPVPELFGSWLQAVGRVKKTPRLRANAVTRSCCCKSYLMPPRGPKRVVAAQRNLLRSLDSLWMSWSLTGVWWLYETSGQLTDDEKNILGVDRYWQK